MRNIAIITARSGSKGLVDKNILELAGYPLMYYTIKAAIEAGCFDTVMVSTDSKKYAQIAKKCGAEVPFLRSTNNASDSAGSWDVVREVLQGYSKQGEQYDYAALLQPTSPLRDAKEIVNAFEMLQSVEINNIVSVTQVEHPVQWCFTMPENHSMQVFASSPYSNMRRQELEVHYRENGAIYIVDARKIMDKDYNFYEDDCYGYIMSREKSIDIDTKLDFAIAEKILCDKMEGE